MNFKIKIPVKFKKITDGLVAVLTKRPVWCLLFLGLTMFSYLAYLFYVAVLKVPPSPPESKVEIKAGIYSKVLERLKQRETDLQQGIERDYPDVFR